MSLESIRNDRLIKLNRLRELGIDPYPVHTNRTHTVGQFVDGFSTLEALGEPVTLAGRILSVREHGGLVFADLFDGSAKIQAYIERETVGEEVFSLFTDLVDVGDMVEVTGFAYTTKRGMGSIKMASWRMLAKSLLPIPDEWYGIKDEDERFRKRYLDILLSKETADRIRRRSLFWNTIRAYLLAQGFVEVETPVLETTTGGADARPFVTHHNALDIDVYLRISAGELWQKKLLVAGLPKVFEIGRIFRNEGMSFEHAQDYTQLEFYQAYEDYESGMQMIMDLYRTIADEVYGTREFTIKDFTIDLGSQWEIYDYCQIIREKFSIDPLDTTVEEIVNALEDAGVTFTRSEINRERGIDLLWKQIRKSLSGPGFLVGIPAYMEPLAKRSEQDPRIVERFQIILAGSEMGKGFSELNDPIDQAERFAHQQALRDGGDEEAQMTDSSFVEALEYGMPPAFGFGVSERLFSFLEDVSVREGQIFPLMRPKDETNMPRTKDGKKENTVAVAVLNKSELEDWQVLNTAAHLGAAIGARVGRGMFSKDSIGTRDEVRLPLNIQHAIMIKSAESVRELRDLYLAAKEDGLEAVVFTREMIETTSDKKVAERTLEKDLEDIEFLGILVYGPQSRVTALTEQFPLSS